MLTSTPRPAVRGAVTAQARREQNRAYAEGFDVLIGVDCGRTFHQLVARGRDGRRKKAIRVDVSRAGFDAANAHLQQTFPGLRPSEMLVGMEFAGHHGFTFAHGVCRVTVELVRPPWKFLAMGAAGFPASFNNSRINRARRPAPWALSILAR